MSNTSFYEINSASFPLESGVFLPEETMYSMLNICLFRCKMLCLVMLIPLHLEVNVISF